MEKAVTQADYQANRLRISALYVMLVLAIAASTLYAQHATRAADLANWNRCTDRNINIVKANTFYSKMAALEQTNKFIDTTLRDERVKLYQSVIYVPANCGKRP